MLDSISLFFCTGRQFSTSSSGKKPAAFENIGYLSPLSSGPCKEAGLGSTTASPSWVGLHYKAPQHSRFLNLGPLGGKAEPTGSQLSGAHRAPLAPSSAFSVRPSLQPPLDLWVAKAAARDAQPPQSGLQKALYGAQSPTASGCGRLGRVRRSSCALTSRRRTATLAPPTSPRVRFPAGARRPERG